MRPPATIAFSWCTYSNFTMVSGTQITIVTGAYKPTYNWGGATLKVPWLIWTSNTLLVKIKGLKPDVQQMSPQRSAAIAGARESLETAPGSYNLILDNRKVRLTVRLLISMVAQQLEVSSKEVMGYPRLATPPVITIFIGGMVAIPSHGWFMTRLKWMI